VTRVLQLTDPRAEDVRLAGRPMATLARLVGQGLPVPPGFVVTTECGEWADPEAEAAVYRAYHALGDGRGGLPTVCTIASPQTEEDGPSGDGPSGDGPSGEGSPPAQQSLSTLDELLAGIDACRGGARHDQGRPYYPGPPATFMAVGVLQLGIAGLSGGVAIRRLDGDDAYEAQHLWSTTTTPGDDAMKLAALDLARRVGELLRSDATVEWAVIDGHPVVVRARCLASGAVLSP